MLNQITVQSKSLLNGAREWWPIVCGLLMLYVPTYYYLFTGLWAAGGDQAHGPIVLAVVLFLFFQNHKQLKFRPAEVTSPITGTIVFTFGLLCYVVGRSQDILMMDLGSQIFIFAGILLLTRGFSVLKIFWFPIFFIVFMIPLPSVFIDAVTQPMKMAVSFVAEHILYWFGYPISRTGVILQIGQYQLLVADACAGMHTLISLEALGLLYLSLIKHNSLFRNLMLAILIIPISFSANVIRVIVLTLVTYNFGDAAGQGFIHGFAGMVLFVVALGLIMSVDTILQYIAKAFSSKLFMKSK